MRRVRWPERRFGAAALPWVLVLAAAAPAHADYWTPEPERAIPRIRLSPRLSFWAGSFERPARACKDTGFPTSLASPTAPDLGGLGRALTPGFVCNTSGSGEIGIGAAAEIAFGITGPLFITAALEVLYTFPNRDYSLKNQLILPLAIGVLLTWPAWRFRPILAAKITPLLYLTDDTRDFAVGGEGGFALRLSDWGDIAFTLGKHNGDSIDAWQVQLAAYPL